MFTSITAVKRANRAIGHHWFDRDTMRFFNTVIESELIAGRWFITSERMNLGDPKRYTVREARANGDVTTSGDFRAYNTRAGALTAAHELAEASDYVGGFLPTES